MSSNILEIGHSTRFPLNDPTKGGRKPSIKNQLNALLNQNGKLTIPKKQVIKINKDGSVVVALPTQTMLAMKLNEWAIGKSAKDSIKAIQMIMEQIDGKPKQEVEITPPRAEKIITVEIIPEKKELKKPI